MQEAVDRGGDALLVPQFLHESCGLRFEGHDPRRIPACVSDVGKKAESSSTYIFGSRGEKRFF